MNAVLLLLAVWLGLSFLGWSVLAPCGPGLRAKALPAAPVLGAALTVVVLHGTSWWLPVRLGVWFLLAVVLVLVGVALRLHGRLPLPRPVDLAALVAGLAVAAVPVAVALQPLVASDGVLVHPRYNNDAYYYVSVAEWLVDEQGDEPPTLGAAPAPGADSIAYAPARAIIAVHLRLGESLVQAAASVGLGVEPTTLWYPLTTLWLALVAGSVLAAFRVLGLGSVAGGMVGALVAAAPVAMGQALNQNSASMLGLAMAPVVLALVSSRLDGAERVPLWLASLVLAAWVGTYTEYLVLGVPAALGMVLVRPWRAIGPALLEGLKITGGALVMAPFVWWNAVQSLLLISELPANDFFASPYLRVSAWELANRITMVAPPDGGQQPGPAAPAVALVLLVGAVVAVWRGPARGVAVGLLTGFVVAFGLFTFGDPPNPYNQLRLVDLGLPLVVLVAGMGWYLLWHRARTGLPRAAGVGTGAALVLVWGALGAVYVDVDRRLVVGDADGSRVVDGSFAEAAAWVAALGEDGEEVTVLVPDFFDQLWLNGALRDLPLVSYPVLDTSYFGQVSYWAGERDRYLLVDRTVWLDAEESVVVAENERFRLLDTARGPVTAAALKDTPPYDWYPMEEGLQSWMIDDGEVIVWRSEDAPDVVELELTAFEDLAPLTVDVLLAEQAPGQAPPEPPLLARAEVGATPTTVTVPLPPGSVGTVLRLDNSRPAVPATSVGDPRTLSVRLDDVAAGG